MCVFVEVEGRCGCLCAMRPPKPPTGGQAVTAQLIVVSIWAAGKGTMAASVLAYPLQLWTMAASVLAYPLQL